MAVDPDLKFVPLVGTSLAIVVTSVLCCVVSSLAVGLRAFVRFRDHLFGWDDGLILGGLILYVVEVILACLGAYSGLGAVNSRLNSYLLVQSVKYLMIWMLLYVVSLVMIKTSICMTMLRIGSPIKALRWSVYILLGFCVTTFFATFIGILLLCDPVEANWNQSLVAEGKATCRSINVMIGLSYFSTASSIATDMACAILPGLIVWNVQMKFRMKVGVCILLSFGSLAGISTIIRTPYIRYYLDPTNNLVYHVGNIVLWSNIESAIGFVASSMPFLRLLFTRQLSKNRSQMEYGSRNNTPDASAAIGLSSGRRANKSNRGFKNPTDLGVSVTTIQTRGDDWRRLDDEPFKFEGAEGDGKNVIRTDHTFQVELTSTDSRAEYKSLGGSSREEMLQKC